MRNFLRELWGWRTGVALVWGPEGEGAVPPPASGTVLALAPHPDDAESAAVTLRLLKNAGCDVFITVLTTSPGGVDDEYVGPDGDTSKEGKARIRVVEQEAAIRLLELEPDRLRFLALDLGEDLNETVKRRRVETLLSDMAPNLVILPAGEDTNGTHRWVCELFRLLAPTLAVKLRRPIVGLYSEDPKTVTMRDDLYVLFGEAEAQWKRRLLRCHDSQQQRNLRNRGCGFDDRILETNRAAFERFDRNGEAEKPEKAGGLFAEAFELEIFEPTDDARSAEEGRKSR